MINTGYLYSKDNKRIFINTCLGCTGECSYCYLGKMGYDNSKIISKVKKAEDLIDEIERKTLISKDTLITLGCFSECDEPNKRFETFGISTKLPIPTVLYMKPILKGITKQDIELYKQVIQKYGIKDVVVGSIFGEKETEESVHFSDEKRLFYNPINDELEIKGKLLESGMIRVFSRSPETMKYYKDRLQEKVK